MKPRAAVIVFPGSNGDRDLAEALSRAGFTVARHDSRDPLGDGYSLVGLPGGFAFGDYWRAGMLASQARVIQDIPPHVESGGLVIGICNGFQILVEAGLLPGALRVNHPEAVYRHGWITIRRSTEVVSPWLDGISDDERLRMPMAHGEGNYFHPDGASAIAGRVAFRYTENPNGSLDDTAALTDKTGRILGIMPHPERASLTTLGSTDGAKILSSAYRYCAERV